MQNSIFRGRLWRWSTIIAVLAAVALLAGLVIGCSSDTDGDNNNNNNNGQVSQFPLTLIDDTGRTVTIDSEPQKIISLSPSNTETAFALGLGDKIVGVTTYCDYPATALDKPKVGGFSTVDIEQVTAIQPDLVLASNIHVDEVVPQLENLGLTLIVVDPRGLDEILDSIVMVGRATGKYSEAVALVLDMESRINNVKSKVAGLTDAEKPRVFFVIWHDPLMTAGPDTNHFALIETAGGISVSRGMADGFPSISLEALLAADPDIMISDTGMGSGGSSPYQFISADPRLAGTSARINGNIYQIDSNVVNRAGPRIVDALEEMATIIHPELFE